MIDTKKIAQEIVDAINKTTNDYDAVDEATKILNEHLETKPDVLKKTKI